MKLRYLLFVGITLVSIIPILILVIWVQKPVLQKEIDAVNDKHLLMAKTLSSVISRYVQDIEAVFRYAAQKASSGQFPEDISGLLKPLNFKHICITDTKGKVISSVLIPGVESIGEVPPSVIRMALSNIVEEAVAFTGVMPGPDDNPVIYITMRISADRLVIGALGTEYIQNLQQLVSFGERGHAAIVDQKGRILSHPNKDWISAMKDLSAVKPVKHMIAGERGVTTFYSPATKQTMVAGYAPVAKIGWGAMVPQPMMELEEDAYYLFETTLKIIAIGVIGAAIISWWLAGYLSGPVRAVAQAARKMASGKFNSHVSIGKTSPVELRSLADSFNSMVDKIASSSQELKQKSTILQTTLDHMDEGITLVDRESNLILANQRFADFFELPPELSIPPLAFQKIIDYLAKRGEFGEIENLEDEIKLRLEEFSRPHQFRFEHLRPDDSAIELSGVPLPNGSKVISYVDVTERRNTEETLRNLQEISASRQLDFNKRLLALLQLGCKQFKMDSGVLSHINENDYEIVQAVTADKNIQPGTLFDIRHTYCETVIKTNQLVCFEQAGRSDWKRHFCYRDRRPESYIGIPIIVERKVYGTLNFSCLDIRGFKFTSTEKELMGLMAQWVGSELLREQTMRTLFEEKERALVTLHSIGEAVITTNSDGIVQYLNPVAEELVGWGQKAANGQPLNHIFRILDESTRQPITDIVDKFVKKQVLVARTNTRVLLRRDLKEYTIEESIAPIIEEPNHLLGLVLVFRDVTEARRLSKELGYRATHDALTGLINRSEFESRLDDSLIKARAERSEHALCYLDLDQFKIINDSCGHGAGDVLLKQLGALLLDHMRQHDTLARLGGDEFGVLLDCCPLNEAIEIAEALVKVVQEFRFLWANRIFTIGVSIGVVPLTKMSDGIVAVLGAADSCCYAAKESGGNRIHVYRENDEQLVKRRGEMKWFTRLPRIIEENRLQLYFQPICPVDQQNFEGDQFEILLRLHNDQDKVILPGAFLPPAERYGLSTKIDLWVINAVFEWLASSPDHLKSLHLCSINLSGHSLCDSAVLTCLTEKLKKMDISPFKICFEITETAAVGNLRRAIKFINAIHSFGCKFALDDFGTGVSSFAYLKNLPVDYLKIDGVFLKDNLKDPIDRSMVQSINHIGHVMHKKTIAEFVEDMSVVDILREIGVDYCQGYAFGHPKPISEMKFGGFYDDSLKKAPLPSPHLSPK